MGVKCRENLGGKIIYRCDTCNTYLTHRGYLVSTRFASANGPFWLFKKVVNIHYDNAMSRNMVTGRHIVRYIYCKGCSAKLGWFYEMAFLNGQEYKEGCKILEVALIREETDDMPETPFGKHILSSV
ncbi:Protein yippee [Araneus ventricosus]|uniref:Protein yippee-like n=1 Tax=Araneus ventricosus TaxID=182803 RepID=A0A4Y2MQQ5_ARAVE|nr:Protein yippee [Araneus ventricosus]